jgi:hypothetical protein
MTAPYKYVSNVMHETEDAQGTAFVRNSEGSYIAQSTTHEGRMFLERAVEMFNMIEREN